MENLSPVLAQRLKDLRESRGLTLAALSKALTEEYGIQISKESLTNYEVVDSFHSKARKNEGMSVKYLRCLADFYCVSTDYLLGITDIPNTDTDMQAVHKFTGLSAGAIAKLQNIYDENRKTAFSDIISLLIEDSNAEYFIFLVGELISLTFDNSGHKLIHVDVDDSRMVAYKEKLLNSMLQINFTERIPEISREYRQQFATSPAQRRKLFDEFIQELHQRQTNGELTESEYKTMVSAWFKEVSNNGQHHKNS